MKVEFEISVDRLLLALTELGARYEKATEKATSHVLHQVQHQQRNMLSIGEHDEGTPTGSVPPMPPWRISGTLSRSVWVEEPKFSLGGWTGRVGPTAIYGRIQELGGWTGAGHRTHLPARPSLKPAWAIVRRTAMSTYAKYWALAQHPL